MTTRKEADPLVQDALRIVRAAGYIPLKEPSYRKAQERQRLAEARRDWAERDCELTREWAREAFHEQRRMSYRCTYLYGLAAKLGATFEQLTGTDGALVV